MTAIAVSLDGECVATVNCDAFEVVSFHLGGTRVDEAFADLNLHALGGESLWWLHDVDLQPGQRVGVEILADAETQPEGITLEALYPDAAADEPIDFDDAEAVAALVAGVDALPQLRDGYRFDYASSVGTQVAGCSAEDMHGIYFSVVWNRYHPERVRVALHTCTLDSVGKQEGCGTLYLVNEDLIAGQSLNVTISGIANTTNKKDGA